MTHHVFERGVLRVDESGEIVGLQEEEEIGTRKKAQERRNRVRFGPSCRRTKGKGTRSYQRGQFQKGRKEEVKERSLEGRKTGRKEIKKERRNEGRKERRKIGNKEDRKEN